MLNSLLNRKYLFDIEKNIYLMLNSLLNRKYLYNVE